MGKKTLAYASLDKKHVWHPFTRMLEWEASAPIVIARAKGNYLYDTNGKKYLDANSSLWVNVHGHRKKEIDNAIGRQLKLISHSTLLGLGSIPSIELAKKLAHIAPKGLTKVFYSDNGSTAVEIALKMALHYWKEKDRKTKKSKFVAFTGAYHGDTVGAMGVGEIDFFVARYKTLLSPAFRAPYAYCYRCPLKKIFPSCEIACLDEFEKILKKNSTKIAACIIEPLVQGAAGMVVSPPGFLKGIERLCKKYNVLLIADEVATGFGRTGRMFACEHEDVRPDFLCLAKGITGGYMPLAATLTSAKIYKAFLGTRKNPDAFYHGHTYTGNQLGCSAALANLDIFEKERTITRLKTKIKLFTKLTQDLNTLPHVGEARNMGLMGAIELVADKRTKKPFPFAKRTAYRACSIAIKEGFMLRPIFDTIIVIPPLSVTEKEIKRLFAAIKKSILIAIGKRKP